MLASVSGQRSRPASVEAKRDLADVTQHYLEPIAALQDVDLGFPGPITFAYYAICNLYRNAVIAYAKSFCT